MTQQVHAHMSLSLDGYGTGLNQTRENRLATFPTGSPCIAG